MQSSAPIGHFSWNMALHSSLGFNPSVQKVFPPLIFEITFVVYPSPHLLHRPFET